MVEALIHAMHVRHMGEVKLVVGGYGVFLLVD
jgi:hypothetical protein